MKTNLLRLLLLPLMAVSLPAVVAAAGISEAQRDYAAGNIVEAKRKFSLILESDPKNVVAKNYLKMIEASEAKNGGDASVAEMQKLVLPTINYNEATLREVLAHIKTLAEKASDGKIRPNFVVQPDVDATKPVTLQLSEVPLSSALEYIGSLTGTKFTYDKYAIQVKLAGPTATAQ